NYPVLGFHCIDGILSRGGSRDLLVRKRAAYPSARDQHTNTPLAGGGKETPPMLKLSTDASSVQAGEMTLTLDEIAREGARRMLQAALEAEVGAYLERCRGERDERGNAPAGRNGKARHRRVPLAAGPVEIAAPRVNGSPLHQRAERERVTSEILPPHKLRSPQVAEGLPVLSLPGLSTGDFKEALPAM